MGVKAVPSCSLDPCLSIGVLETPSRFFPREQCQEEAGRSCGVSQQRSVKGWQDSNADCSAGRSPRDTKPLPPSCPLPWLSLHTFHRFLGPHRLGRTEVGPAGRGGGPWGWGANLEPRLLRRGRAEK